MTLPVWPDGVGQISCSIAVAVPQAVFSPTFGPAIQRPRSTALDEMADFVAIFTNGEYPAFRQWWSEQVRGGDFVWHRMDTAEDVIVRPTGGSYSAEIILAHDIDNNRPGAVRVSFSGALIPVSA